MNHPQYNEQRNALVRLGVAKKRPGSRLLHAHIGRKADSELAEARAAYAAMLGRPISQSLIVRRSLELLREHLRSVVRAPDEVTEEVQAIARNVK